MTWTTAEAFARIERRVKEARARRYEMQRKRNARVESALCGAQLMSANAMQQIKMHITPWWYDEFGNKTRQIWAVGSIIER